MNKSKQLRVERRGFKFGSSKLCMCVCGSASVWTYFVSHKALDVALLLIVFAISMVWVCV